MNFSWGVLAALALFLATEPAHASIQSIAVKGQLLCGNQTAEGVRVRIVDDDTGLDPDDDLDETETDKKGRFELSGYEDEWSDIDVYLKIYHNCVDGITPCDRRWRMKIPDHYITDGSRKPNKVFDIGVWNLEVEMEEEERDCFK